MELLEAGRKADLIVLKAQRGHLVLTVDEESIVEEAGRVGRRVRNKIE